MLHETDSKSFFSISTKLSTKQASKLAIFHMKEGNGKLFYQVFFVGEPV